ncbi:hypothetical protein [Prochlorococcus sp. MIT 1307]|uniref:tetratricopeptide repeat protein n=1 Tax=Prochlorococcus sp. MIT 1307 TaxID=3096219 RepID=UPI002A75B616|nr:hypothetical protein [Prochlorococcus sp. MIT 1307]
MNDIPSNCSRCGAPINWSKDSKKERCEFCGQLNVLRNSPFDLDSLRNKLSKSFTPFSDSFNHCLRAFIKKQSLLSDVQINHIINNLKSLYANNYFRILIVAVPITLITNSIISDPLRPYKGKINDQCNLISNYQSKTDFNAKKVFKKCVNTLSKDVYYISRLSKNKKSKLYTDKDTMSKYPMTSKGVELVYDYNYSKAIIWFSTGLEQEISKIKEQEKNRKMHPKVNKVMQDIRNIATTQFDSHMQKARKKSQLKNHRGAIIEYTKALSIFPDSHLAFTFRAIEKVSLEQYNDAIDDYKNAIKNALAMNVTSYKGLDMVYTLLAQSQTEMQDFKGAFDSYTSALKIDINNAGAYFGRAMLEDKLTFYDREDACNDFKKAASLDSHPSYDKEYYPRMAANCN